MSLLPNQILPQTVPLGRVEAKGDGSEIIVIDKDWWLFLYNISEQVLANGSGATIVEISNSALFKAKGTDYSRQIADLQTMLETLPNPAGRIATLERQVADLQQLLATTLQAH